MAAKKQEEINPGTQVRVEIIKAPTNEAAEKTLVRLLAKDPVIAKTKKKDKLFHARSVRTKGRGGRPWEHRTKMRQPVETKVGVAGTLRASVDVLKDLASVSRFVKVTSA